jgi:Hemerythrin HHE cation binding domain
LVEGTSRAITRQVSRVQGTIGSREPVPANIGDRSTVDRGIPQSHAAPPLVVDLDGTLTARGTIRACLCQLARERPWWLPRRLVSLVRGRAACKDHLAHLVDLAPERVPYRPQVLVFLRAEQARGRQLILATAAPRRIADAVLTARGIQTTLEEELFYPAMQRKADQGGKDRIAEAMEAHHVVTTLMEELKGLDPKDERYDAEFTVLMDNLAHHIEEEAGEMFLEAEEVLGDRLERLSQPMQART